MADSLTLSDLLLRWRELRGQGKSCRPEDVCADCPEKTEELRPRIEAVERMEQRLGVSPSSGSGSGPDDSTLPPEEGAPVEPPPIDPFLVPGYELLDVLGQGGMGVVYKARQLSLKRLVALKMIRADFGAARQELARFRTEAESLAHARHPNIIEIYDVGEAAGRPYFTMELVEGGSLAQALADGPLGPHEAARLVRTVAQTVHVAHQRGIIHRDLKPGNVLLDCRSSSDDCRSTPTPAPVPDGRGQPTLIVQPIVNRRSPIDNPKITDFGLAKRMHEPRGHTVTGAVLGTPGYMAPEQAEGKSREVGPATDVWALGAILYECLCGQPPFVGETAVDTLLRVTRDDPVPPGKVWPGVPRELDAICLKCLEKDPARRYPTAADLADDLGRFLDAQPVQARSLSALGRGVRWLRRRPERVVLAGVLALSLLTLLAFLLFQRDEARENALAAAPQAGAILHHYCYECHGEHPDKLKGRLDVLDYKLLIGETRGLVKPRDPRGSRLLERIQDGSMPPQKAEEHPRLSFEEIDVLKTWIAGGAPPFSREQVVATAERPAEPTDLSREAKKIFKNYCYECHGIKAKEEVAKGIAILNHDLLLVKRRVVIPEKPDESLLMELLESEDPMRMMPPPDSDQMTFEERQTIRRWIEEGARPFPRDKLVPAP